MKHIIYQIKNNINNKIYVGKHSTHDINDDYMGSGTLIKRAIEKYGPENFTKTILHVFNDEFQCFIKESEIVNEEFVARNDTYNLRSGGDGGFTVSEETRQKMREIARNRPPEHHNKVRNTRIERGNYITKGIPHTKETKQRISEQAKHRYKNNIGYTWTEETNAKRAEALKGNQHALGSSRTKDWKKYRSEQYTGKNNPNFGKPMSNDTKQSISNSHKTGENGTCPHCGKTGKIRNLKPYHFDNCKHKK